MEEFKTINRTTQVLKIASCLQKLYRKIVESKKKNVDDHNIKELAFLRSQCKAENVHLSLMACQTLVKLVEEKALDLARVLSDLTSLIPNSTPSQYTAITEGIVSLLLLSLKRQIAQNESRQFQNPYGLKNPQHPLIVLIHQDGSNMIDIASKISGICNHNDKEIRIHSIEFLRPVLLYIFCNPQSFPDSKVLWTGLLTQSSRNPVAQELIKEILTWSKISSPETCLFTSLILLEAIDHYQNQDKFEEMVESYIYLALVVNQLILFGIDPRPSLQSIYRCLHIKTKYTKNSLNVLLVILSKTLHIISPFYLPEILRILYYIIVTENCGNQYILNMVLDGTIQWMSQTAFIPVEGQSLADKVIKKIIAGKGTEDAEQISTADFSSDVRNFHPDIALSFDIANLAESFEESEYKNIFTFIDTINIKSKLPFCRKMNLFLRAIFLSKEPSLDCWFKVYQTILSIVKSSEDVAVNLLMTYLYKLASETNPEVQLELLKGLPSFAVSKDNIPMILNTIKTISTGPNLALAMDLFLRVWKLEVRTYPFLSKLFTPQKKESWSIQITKAHTIREICLERPTQYGPDLVKYLSDILNNCSNEDGSLATSIALEAIVALCESNTVNITSTWKALNGKFRHEKRTKVLKSLYKLFGQVPLLPSPTADYESLVDECLETLWLIIAASNDTELINEALKTLVNFKPGTIMTLRHIPEKFINPSFVIRNEIINFDHIAGEVWVELLRKVKPACIREAGNLISHYISDEISGYRSGTYHLTEGKPEPRKLAGLHAKSVLRAITNYLVMQSRVGDSIPEPAVVTGALRSISKKFSKPIPPLDWCFLHSFFHLSFEARKYCVLIAKNQVLHSGTAKRLLENFLVEFEPNIFEADLLLIFSILPEIANGVSLPILRSFVEKIATYCFRESQLNGFVEGCLFEKFLDSVKSVFLGNVESPEVLSLFTSIAERFMDSMDLDSKLFERYTELVSVLHPSSIDGLTSPNNWWEIPVTKLKKATIIRCYLVLYNTQIENPLTWLDPLIDAYANLKEEQIFFFRHLAITLFAYNDDKTACSWVMNLSLKIQGLLSDVSKEDRQQKVIFLIDIYILTVVVLSGCAVLLGNLNVAATSPTSRNEIFPESLQMLCDQEFWKENEAKIYEFLYHLHKNHPFLQEYSDVFRSAIICSRNNVYFDSKSVWIKYVGMRK